MEVFENQARPEKEYQALDHPHDPPMNQTSMFANHGEIGERSDLERYDYQSFEHAYGGKQASQLREKLRAVVASELGPFDATAAQ